MSKGDQEDIWVFAEQRSGMLINSSLEILGGARQLSGKLRTGVAAVLLGHQLDSVSKELTAHGADRVYVVDHRLLSHYRSEFFVNIMADMVTQHKPAILLLSATSVGMDLAPRLAARLRTGLTADCVALNINYARQLVQVVPAFGGNVMATIVCPRHRPQMATVRPGVMRIPERNNEGQGTVTEVKVNLKEEDLKLKIVDFVSEKPRALPIEEADIIIAGGYGVGGLENWKLVEDLAKALGGAVGATRPPIDEKWALEDQMIGQSGKTVHPKLYIAAGISGELQHIVGIQDSKIIVAINKDPNAQIFKVADIGIVGDLREILPLLIRQVKNSAPR